MTKEGVSIFGSLNKAADQSAPLNVSGGQRYITPENRNITGGVVASDKLGASGPNKMSPTQQSPNYRRDKSGWIISENGDAEFNSIRVRERTRVVKAGEDIAHAIDMLEDEGGGVIALGAGIHRVSSTITINTNGISLVGVGKEDTIIDFEDNNARILYDGRNSAPFQKAVSSLTSSGNVVTATTTLDHGFATGDVIAILNATQGGYNGEHEITVTGATTFTYLAYGITVSPATTTTTIQAAEFNRVSNFTISDLTLRNSGVSSANAALSIYAAKNFTVTDIIAENSVSGIGILIQGASDFVIDSCKTRGNATSGLYIRGVDDFTDPGVGMTQQFTVKDCLSEENGAHGIFIEEAASGTSVRLIDFVVLNSTGQRNTSAGFQLTGRGNGSIDGQIIACQAEYNTGDGFNIGAEDMAVIGCDSDSNIGDGFEVTRTQVRLLGNSSRFNTGTEYKVSADVRVTLIGNIVSVTSTVAPSGQVDIADRPVTMFGSTSESTVTQKITMQMKNTSGDALAVGDVVVLKAVAAGDEVTTTTTGGDKHVYGMVMATIADTGYGPILTIGKTTKLKVNGGASAPENIAIGDYLSTFTTAKIAKKAASGDMAFAVALGAYAVADSSGVIDALLVSPRLMP